MTEPDTRTTPPAERQRTVAVLGGTGFVGRALCASFEAAGDSVLALARTEPADLPAARFRRFDLSGSSAASLAELLLEEGVDVVVNAAGGMWGLSDEQMVEANVGLVGRVVEAVTSLPRRVRLIHLGTVHEYGMAPVGRSQSEQTTPQPVMVYGELKLRAAEIVTDAVAEGRLDAVVLRVGNVVGAGQPGHSLLGVMAAKLAEAGAAGRTAELKLAPLTAQRDFVDLDDTVAAVLAAASAAQLPPVVNVGRGEAVSARRMVELLIGVSGVDTAVTEEPAPAGTGPETEWQCMDVGLAEQALGWAPRRSLEDSVASLWDAQYAGALHKGAEAHV